MKMHPVIYVSSPISYVEQSEATGLAVAKKTSLIEVIQGEEHVVYKFPSNRRRGRMFLFLTVINADPHYEAVWKPKKDFVDND